MRITTWADGFGRWHARVPHCPTTKGALRNFRAAREAIREEMQARESRTQPVHFSVWMNLERRPEYDTDDTIVYAEKSPT